MRLLCAMFMLFPMQALALSCVPWGVTNAYLDADAAEQSYVVVYGDLDFDTDDLPKRNIEQQQFDPPLSRITAQFSGQALVPKGADVPLATPVTVEVQCLGPWCSLPQPGQVLAFLRKDGADYVAATNPCGGYLFSDPNRDQLKQVRQCLRGRKCLPLGVIPD